jgi:CheY-like chemotaxis protein
MRILIVEDDEHKREVLVAFVQGLPAGHEVLEARSLQSGLDSIIDGRCDVVLLDMAMPAFDRSAEQREDQEEFAGVQLLRQVRRLGITVPIVVVTQFDQFGEGPDALTLAQLDERLRKEHANNYRGAVYYNVAFDDWKGELTNRLNSIAEEGDLG